jgi:hypothetical protein
MKLRSGRVWQFALTLAFSFLAAISAHAQTPGELRARYGEPQMSQLKNGHPVVERYLLRPNILMTIRYTKYGRLCEALIEPVTGSTPSEGRVEHAPEGDYMSTAEVIKIINGVVPIEKRGKKISDISMNGGDPEMKLHHPGCWGAYMAFYGKVTVSSSSWCWGGTFSAIIHWRESNCPDQKLTVKRRRSKSGTSTTVDDPWGRLTIKHP